MLRGFSFAGERLTSDVPLIASAETQIFRTADLAAAQDVTEAIDIHRSFVWHE